MLSQLNKRASVVPSSCYDDCNALLLEIQNTVKTSEICNPNSTFAEQFTNCSDCISFHAGTGVPVAPAFQQFLDYCGTNANPAIASALAVLSALGISITLSATSTPVSLLDSKSLTKSPTSSNTGLPSPALPATAAPIETASSQHLNWIAGAVIGPVFLLALAITVLYLLRKKSQRARLMPQEEMIETKAQLHGDDIQPIGPALLENTEPATELPSNELIGSELNAV
ncbi:hypothetical protein GP486_002211 [Trichoglossum hirsutum]|uniref:Uncharacterized protein n=1 Tax=Trichoglossum hirsutum TaxID=265104 RepID=A0A9P8LFD2_9PEZI|nr:hypothetical protein GP486_002211 [Trichoglossum hirsutum]